MSGRLGEPSLPAKLPRLWLIPALLGAAGVVALALWQPWRTSPVSPPAPEPTAQRRAGSAATAVVEPTSQALRLRAFEGLTRERLGAAEELLAQALKTAPTDADALAMAAQVDALMVFRSWDMSEARRQSATRRSARALALAPEGFEPRRAQAMVAGFMIRSPESTKEAETLYRALAAERASDQSVLEELGTLLQGLRRFDEAAEVFVQGRRPQLAGNAYYAGGRVEEARRIADELLAQRRSAAALILKANVELFGYNDRAAAQAAVNQLTSTELREDDAAGIALRLAVLSRDAPGLLRLLEPFPHPFVSLGGVNYPRQYWTGLARSLLNQPEAAQIEWRGGLRSLEERLRSRPNDADALSWAAMFHAVLGDRAAMEQALRTYANYRDLTTGRWDFNHCLPLVRLGERTDEVIARLAKSLREAANSNRILYAWARYSPEFDPIRGDPRFEQLLREVRPKSAQPFDDELSARPAALALDPKSVAVLPFTNLSGDKEQEYFSDGLTEEILNALARERDLRVPGRMSSFSFKGKNVSAAEIAAALNVSRLVEGSVQRSGTKVRIRMSLTRVADNASEELGTFTEELTDIFALYDKVARAVVEKLTHRQPASSVEVLTKNTEAYDLYLRGRALQTSSAANTPAAAKLYERAVALDPSFALAWAQLAATKIRLYRERDNSAEVVAAARAAVGRALALKPDLPEALLIRARITRLVDLDYAAAQRDVDRAAALQPPTAELRRSQGAQALAGGDRRETARLYEEALTLDPQDGDTANALAIQYRRLGLLIESDRLYARAMKIAGADGATPFSNRIEMRTLWRGAAAALHLVERAPADQAARDLRRLELLARVGRLDEARKLADEIRRTVGDGADINPTQVAQSKYPNVLLLQAIGREPWAKSLAEKLRAAALKELERGNRASLVCFNLVQAEIVLRHRDAALNQLEAWRRDAQRSIGIGRLTNFSQWAVGLYAQLGKADEELALLGELSSNGLHFGYSLRTDPLLAPLRDDARFQELMKQEEAWAKAQPDPVEP